MSVSAAAVKTGLLASFCVGTFLASGNLASSGPSDVDVVGRAVDTASGRDRAADRAAVDVPKANLDSDGVVYFMARPAVDFRRTGCPGALLGPWHAMALPGNPRTSAGTISWRVARNRVERLDAHGEVAEAFTARWLVPQARDARTAHVVHACLVLPDGCALPVIRGRAALPPGGALLAARGYVPQHVRGDEARHVRLSRAVALTGRLDIWHVPSAATLEIQSSLGTHEAALEGDGRFHATLLPEMEGKLLLTMRGRSLWPSGYGVLLEAPRTHVGVVPTYAVKRVVVPIAQSIEGPVFLRPEHPRNRPRTEDLRTWTVKLGHRKGTDWVFEPMIGDWQVVEGDLWTRDGWHGRLPLTSFRGAVAVSKRVRMSPPIRLEYALAASGRSDWSRWRVLGCPAWLGRVHPRLLLTRQRRAWLEILESHVDAEGRARIKGLEPGRWSIALVSPAGCIVARREESIGPASSTPKAWAVQPTGSVVLHPGCPHAAGQRFRLRYAASETPLHGQLPSRGSLTLTGVPRGRCHILAANRAPRPLVVGPTPTRFRLLCSNCVRDSSPMRGRSRAPSVTMEKER